MDGVWEIKVGAGEMVIGGFEGAKTGAGVGVCTHEVTPFPAKPGLQAQVAPPAEFVQVAWG